MGVFDDIGNAISDGAGAVVDVVVDGAEAVVETVEEAVEDTEEAIDEGMKEIGEWFIDKINEAIEDFFTDGGTDVGHNEFEERATASGRLEIARVIDYDYARPYGSDDDELTLPPSHFTSRFSDTDANDLELDGFHVATEGAFGTIDDAMTESDAGSRHAQERDVITDGSGPLVGVGSRADSDQELDGVRLASDGAIGTVDDITTEANGGPRRSPDRSEDHDVEREPFRSPDRADDHQPTGGAGSEPHDGTGGETLSEARVGADSLQFLAATDTGGTTLTEAATEHDSAVRQPQWASFNDSDPATTLLDGGFLTDLDLRPSDDDRSSRREGRFSSEGDSTNTHSGFATTLEDASPTLSTNWLF